MTVSHMVTRAGWLQRLQEHPDRPQGRQRRQLDVLIALADLLDAETGSGQVSVLEVAKAAGVGERTARRALAWAVRAGVLQRSLRGRGRGAAEAAVSAWQLAVSEKPRLAANSENLAANSRGLAANPASKRTGKRGTPTPPSVSEVLAHRDYCRGCGFDLDPVLAKAGIQVHAGCIDPLDDAPATTARRRTA
jgi:hypothetical protein